MTAANMREKIIDIVVAINKCKLIENASIEQNLTKSFVAGRSINFSSFPTQQNTPRVVQSCDIIPNNRTKSNHCLLFASNKICSHLIPRTFDI